MSGHPDPSVLQRLRSGHLPPAELLRVDRHLTHCETCREGLAPDPAAAQRLIRRVVAGGAHLTYEQIEAKVDGRLDALQRARIEAHLAWCPRCRDEVTDLVRHAEALRQRVERPSAGSAAAGGEPGKRGWFASLSGFLPQIALASVGAVVALTLLLPSRPTEDPAAGLRSLPPSAPAASAASAAAPAFDASALQRLQALPPDAAAAAQSGDFVKLASELRAAANQGEPNAASTLGLLLAEGRGVARDPAAAARYWRAAAQAGDATAAHNLALLRSAEPALR